jgi:hypothetical protein
MAGPGTIEAIQLLEMGDKVAAPLRRAGVVTPSWACGPTRGRKTERMMKISYSRCRFPPDIIHQAIWLYFRFTLSLREEQQS